MVTKHSWTVLLVFTFLDISFRLIAMQILNLFVWYLHSILRKQFLYLSRTSSVQTRLPTWNTLRVAESGPKTI